LDATAPPARPRFGLHWLLLLLLLLLLMMLPPPLRAASPCGCARQLFRGIPFSIPP
jgi:hypothetical protein